MAEWHLTPEYILSNWTNEKMNVMVAKLVERKNREIAAIGGNPSVVSDEQFFKQVGINYKKVNHD